MEVVVDTCDKVHDVRVIDRIKESRNNAAHGPYSRVGICALLICVIHWEEASFCVLLYVVQLDHVHGTRRRVRRIEPLGDLGRAASLPMRSKVRGAVKSNIPRARVVAPHYPPPFTNLSRTVPPIAVVQMAIRRDCFPVG